jgi:hypothetical protein
MNHIATPDQRHSIVTLTMEIMQQYLSRAVPRDAQDMDCLDMHLEDIAYMTRALGDFVRHNDMSILESRIMHQDTYPREYYVKVLWMIAEFREENYYLGSEDLEDAWDTYPTLVSAR